MRTSKDTKRARNQAKKQLQLVRKAESVEREMREVPRHCPYCHGKMVTKKISELDPGSPRGNQFIRVCEHYGDTCTCSVKLYDNLKPKGIPADIKLKLLRCEVHFYIDCLLKLGLFDCRDDVYKWLSFVLDIERTKCHFLMLREDGCQKAITQAVKKLASQPERTKGKFWAYCSPDERYIPYSQREEELNKMLAELNSFR